MFSFYFFDEIFYQIGSVCPLDVKDANFLF